MGLISALGLEVELVVIDAGSYSTYPIFNFI